jgi:hypothetical protein
MIALIHAIDMLCQRTAVLADDLVKKHMTPDLTALHLTAPLQGLRFSRLACPLTSAL